MGNITKQKRDKMIKFLEELKIQHSDDESVREFDEIENHLKYLTICIYREKYTSSPVRRVEIPKPDGGVRKLAYQQ